MILRPIFTLIVPPIANHLIIIILVIVVKIITACYIYFTENVIFTSLVNSSQMGLGPFWWADSPVFFWWVNGCIYNSSVHAKILVNLAKNVCAIKIFSAFLPLRPCVHISVRKISAPQSIQETFRYNSSKTFKHGDTI